MKKLIKKYRLKLKRDNPKFQVKNKIQTIEYGREYYQNVDK